MLSRLRAFHGEDTVALIRKDEAFALFAGLRRQQINLAILVYIGRDDIWRRSTMVDGPLEDCPAANDENRNSTKVEWSNELAFMEHPRS
jgi:hypothetical protein